VTEASYDLLSVADAAIVTSGTATLETGIFKVPQVVVYKMGTLEYSVVSRLVKVKFISLVNLIADKEVIKELIQDAAVPTLLNDELSKLMTDQNYIKKMIEDYNQVFQILDTGSASENAAKLMLDYLTEKIKVNFGSLKEENMHAKTTLIFVVALFFYSCEQPSTPKEIGTASLDLPKYPYDYGTNNNYVPTLGRVLFYDTRLSASNSVACASCHKQALAFADNAQFSRGFAGQLTGRNSMPIQNLSQGGFFDPSGVY